MTGRKVRIYYDDDFYDEGVVTNVADGCVTVDFLDWIEQWPEDGFTIEYIFVSGIEVLIPTVAGHISQDFRKND